jgi:glucose/arabinose dehydrogenase
LAPKTVNGWHSGGVKCRHACLAALLLASIACAGDEAPACQAPARALDLRFEVAEAFPELGAFEEPVGLHQTPALPQRMFVVEKAGRILSFDVRAPAAGRTVVADLRQAVRTRKECGLLGMAFHPRFSENGQVLLSYCAAGSKALRYSRFAYDFASGALDPSSEDVFLELPSPRDFHQAGQMHFDPAGYLLTAVGDTGPHRDPDGHAQNVDDLLGDFLRLDVDGGRPYAIPPDNPFAPGGELAGMGRPEIYAWGFRNPWSFSVDSATGAIWAGDVGFESTEEVDWVRPGRNYGWAAMEGLSCRRDQCEDLGFTPPVATFRNNGNSAVIGGYVYHGQDIPSLQGVYVFANFGGGALYGIFDPYGAAETRRIHPATGLTPSSFHEDLEGELYFTDIGGGRIYQLVASTSRLDDGFPRTLSETGCVTFTPDGQPVPAGGAVPYDVRMPLWSDGAEKLRFVNVAGTRASVRDDGDLDFPVGTVLLKFFRLGDALVEGRLLVNHDDGGWSGYSYEWDANLNDGVLLEEGKTVAVAPGSWTYPSREDCFSCHTSAAGVARGPEVGQFDGAAWPEAARSHVELPRRADAVDDELWVRAYLHANCSNCHRPGGASNADIDLRQRVGRDGTTTSLADLRICNVPPTGDDLGIEGAVLLAPGDPARSLLLQRMARRGEGQMPPLGTDQVDALALERVERWIRALPDCR